MQILITPNSFKNSLSAIQITHIIEQAFESANKEFKIIKQALADGGDGTLEILSGNLDGTIRKINVSNPLNVKIESRYFITNDKIAIIELAEASGLKLLKENELNPSVASTYGTGELIQDAINNGAKKIIIGVGGSATIDAGIGAALALNVHFLDKNCKRLNDINDILDFATKISVDHLAWKNEIQFDILCDVKNPVFGANGGINVYGPQKGANQNFISNRESQFERFINVLIEQNEFNFKNDTYLGASGGFPLVFKALFKTNIHNGAEYIFDFLNIEEKIIKSDIIVTAEGKFDHQSIEGKVPVALAKLAKKHNKPIILITGQTDFWENSLFDGIFPIVNQPNTIQNLLLESEKLVYETARQVALLISKINAKNG
jgi:glycerate 2-kinase